MGNAHGPTLMGRVSILRKTSVAFRSAKVASVHSFAERKTTIKTTEL